MSRSRARRAQALVGAVALTLGVVSFAGPAAAANPWIRVPAPSPSPDVQQLSAVSCTTPTVCTAVGAYLAQSGPKTLIVRTTDGTTWTRLPSPNPGAITSVLSDVHCVSATQCTAVGTYTSRVQDQFPFARSFIVRTTNGTTWQRIQSPNPFNFATTLYGVNCVTATRCRAVGEFEGNSLVLRTGDGVNWFRQETPNRGAAANHLLSIDCVSNVNCTAVGLYFATDSAQSRAKTLAIRTVNGRDWLVVNTPNPSPSGADNTLIDVDCTSTTVCTAVGDVRPAPTNRAFILRTTNGTSWVRAATPVRAGQVDLSGISCDTPVSCTAVGVGYNAAGTIFAAALLRTTDGTSWTSPSPESEKVGRGLSSVHCPTPVGCVGVGTFNATGNSQDPLKSLVMKET